MLLCSKMNGDPLDSSDIMMTSQRQFPFRESDREFCEPDSEMPKSRFQCLHTQVSLFRLNIQYFFSPHRLSQIEYQ